MPKTGRNLPKIGIFFLNGNNILPSFRKSKKKVVYLHDKSNTCKVWHKKEYF